MASWKLIAADDTMLLVEWAAFSSTLSTPLEEQNADCAMTRPAINQGAARTLAAYAAHIPSFECTSACPDGPCGRHRGEARRDRIEPTFRQTQPEISAIHIVRGAGDSALPTLYHRVHRSAIEHPARRSSSIMSKKHSQSLVTELEPFVAPFRFDGSSEFYLKSQKDQGEEWSRQGPGRGDHRGQPQTVE
jgi:hypothetical protein